MSKKYIYGLNLCLVMLFSFRNVSAQQIVPQKKGSKYIYVKPNGDKAFNAKFDDAKHFYHGFAAVSKKGKWGYIDKKGNVVVPIKYQSASEFNKYKKTVVKFKDSYFLINSQGSLISEPFDKINNHSFLPYYIVEKDKRLGIVDSTGRTIQVPIYKGVGAMHNKQITIKKGDKWGVWEEGVENFKNAKLYFYKPEKRAVFSETCSNLASEKERKKCSDAAMLKTVYGNIVYPKEARESGIEGIVVVRFIITETGAVENIKVVRTIGGGCDEEALRVISEKLTKWHQPGFQDGIPINSLFNLPIKYRLE